MRRRNNFAMVLKSFFPIVWGFAGVALLSTGQKLRKPPCPPVNISYVGCPYGLANQCFKDYECPSDMKCCSNSCGRRVCLETTDTKKKSTDPKSGNCPQVNTNGPCIADHDYCNNDGDCFGQQKCCITADCSKRCILPVESVQVETPSEASRPGVCPQPLTEELCEEGESPECVTDTDCVSPSKCCSNGCTKLCAEPDIEEPAVDKNTPKRGVCPFVIGSEVCSSDASQDSECQYDSDCMGDEKCCSDSCKAMKCVEVKPIALFSSHEKEAKNNEKVEAGKNADIKCGKEYMEVAVEREAFDKFGVSRLTLKDSNCLATSNETHYLVRAPLLGCGTSSRHNSESVVYSNEVINRIGESMVTRAQEFKMPFSCFYTKEGVTSTNGLIPKRILTAFNGGNATTSFILEMSLFQSSQYTRPYGPKDFPLQVVLNKPVFIQVAVESPDTSLAVRAHQCYATPTENPASLVRYIIIDEGCSRDRTVEFYSASSPSIQRFSFKAFKFIGQGQSFVFLHCRLVVCNASNPLSECARSCEEESGLGRRNKRSTAEGPAQSLTEGPFIVVSSQKALRQEQEQTRGINVSMWVMIGMGVVCVLSLAGVFYMKRQMSRGTKCNEENVPETRV